MFLNAFSSALIRSSVHVLLTSLVNCEWTKNIFYQPATLLLHIYVFSKKCKKFSENYFYKIL